MRVHAQPTQMRNENIGFRHVERESLTSRYIFM